MIYMYKRDDNTPLIKKYEVVIDTDGDPLELVMITEDVSDIQAYLKSYYNYSDLETAEYLTSYDINI